MKSLITILFSCALTFTNAYAAPITFKLNLPETKLRELEEAVRIGTQEEVLEELLEIYILNSNFNDETLEAIAEYLEIHALDDFKALPRLEQRRLLMEVIAEYTKISGAVLSKMRKQKKGIDLVTDAITSHPAYDYLRGVVPRGHTQSWDNIVGAGASRKNNAVIAADKMDLNFHGSFSVVLHEVGHSVDRFFKDRSEDYDYSHNYKFRPIQKETPFAELFRSSVKYFEEYPEENFAEIFTLYFKSPETRKKLEKLHPKAFAYMQQHF